MTKATPSVAGPEWSQLLGLVALDSADADQDVESQVFFDLFLERRPSSPVG
jgi:hypothetical protein